MIAYSIRKILLLIPTIFVVVTLLFFLLRALPGDPVIAGLADSATESAIQTRREQLGLNKPLLVQYFSYVENLARGDLGLSLVDRRPIAVSIGEALPYTIDLTWTSLLIGIVLGIPMGVVAAVRRNTVFDYVARTLSLFGLSFPTFYLGILLIMVFSVQLKLFPATGGGGLDNLGNRLYHLVLPSLNLGLIMMAYITRMTRSALLEEIQQGYIFTARAKGLREIIVILKHGLRNALITVVTVTGLYVSIIIGSSVLIEIVFNRPGLGKLLVGGINQSDYTMVQSILVIYTAIIVVVNLITDLTYGFTNPRIKYD